MRTRLYQILVNQRPGIAYRYHKVHDKAAGVQKLLSWIYLLWLNFACNILGIRFLGERPDMKYYEEKTLPADASESARAAGDLLRSFESRDPEGKFGSYDILSFDVFDTLILRPLSDPRDLFWFVGEKLGSMDFRNLRIRAEQDARRKKQAKEGHSEVTLAEIWEKLAEMTGLSADEGMRIETETETELCYANPFMRKLWEAAKRQGKRIIVISDMYLPEATIRKVLEKNGYTGAEKIYVSCEYGMNKAGGRLYRQVLHDLSLRPDGGSRTSGSQKENNGHRILHIGDDPHSDGRMAEHSGFDVLLYPQIRRMQEKYRPYDMSYMTGSTYRGIVSNHLYNGSRRFSADYEYGFVCGGLFVLGYCTFIHEYIKKNEIDKALFLARDGDVLKEAYDLLYPGEATSYVFWSRKAGLKLTADEDRYDYFRRFVEHKINGGYRIREILRSMDLEFLTEKLTDELTAEEELTGKNAPVLRHFLETNRDLIAGIYEEQRMAARQYFQSRLDGCKKIAVIDIGWAGSGAMTLSHLIEKVWRFPCKVSGIVAGTNTLHNAEPDASEPFFRSGKLVSYLFSQEHNRDLLKKHDPNKDFNVYWELLLSSPQPPLDGFYPEKSAADRACGGQSCKTDPESGVFLRFGPPDVDPARAAKIRKGILDFIKEYRLRFAAYPYMLRISGRDAYAPVLAAAGHGERYLKKTAERSGLKKNVE